MKSDFPSWADEIAEPRPDMNIKVVAFTVSEKSINTLYATLNKAFTDRSGTVLLLWVVCAVCVLCLSCFRVCSMLPWDGGGWPLICEVCAFANFPMWYPGSGVVPDCIGSWSLPSFLLSLYLYLSSYNPCLGSSNGPSHGYGSFE